MPNKDAIGDAVNSRCCSGYDRRYSVLHQQFAYIFGAEFERRVFHENQGFVYCSTKVQKNID